MPNVSKIFKELERPTANGYEIMVCIQYHTRTNWSWVAIRYPVSCERLQEPSEVLMDFSGMNWYDIIAWVNNYITSHPDDGFWWI